MAEAMSMKEGLALKMSLDATGYKWNQIRWIQFKHAQVEKLGGENQRRSLLIVSTQFYRSIDSVSFIIV
jgi:hypothetical protein